jgi:hypothetical protein
MTEPVWSVIIMLSCGLAFTAYIIYYILQLANEEMKNEEPSNYSINDKPSD